MAIDLAAIRNRWTPIYNDFASVADLDIDRTRAKLSLAVDDIHSLLKLADLVREYGAARIALDQVFRSATEADNATADLALRNARQLHERCIDVVEGIAVELAGGKIEGLLADPVPAGGGVS
jgi:hypothetical protein